MAGQDVSTMVLRLREALGLTQEGLAREIGVTASTVFRWEKGRSQPSGLACKALDRLRARIDDPPGDPTTPDPSERRP